MTAAMGVKDTGDDTSCEFVSKNLSEAQKANRRVHLRVRWPAFLLGAVFMLLSMWWVYTSWTSQAAAFLLIRDVLRSFGCLAWLCAVLPSDRFGSKVGSILLIILGIKCAVWHTDTLVNYMKQLPPHFDEGKPCYIEDEETDCDLGAFTIGTISIMYILMHLVQLPYLALGLRLPSRATVGRLWVGLAMLHLTKGATDFVVLLPAMAVKASWGKTVSSWAILYCTLHGVYGVIVGSLLMLPAVRRWVHFQLLKASGAYRAASSIAGFLGNRSKEKIMEAAKNACRYISMGKIRKEDMTGSTPNPLLQSLSTPCGLQDIDAFLSHSWHDDPEAKWEALQIWRMSFKAQHQREPRLWIDKYCIDQDNIEASLMCLPVFLASCHTLLILAGPTFLKRLWCIEEVFVFLQMNRPIHAMEIMAICDDMENRVSTFDVKDAACSKEKDRQKMLATIEAGCESYEAFNMQVRAALLAALKRAV